ncbi:MAG: histidinol-phosphatase [Gammaproteobacteria bacterium]
MSTEPDLIEFSRFAHALADAAREVTMGYFRRPIAVESKADASPVTIADRNTEKRMRELIAERFPAHGIYGEEYGNDMAGQSHVWVLDPIDGTKSFITGLPTFGTLIALMRGEQTLVGIIEMPALGERFVGVQGHTTTWNGLVCASRRCERLEDAVMYSTSLDQFIGIERACYDAIAAAVKLRRFGGDCYSYGLLAGGFVDLVVESDMEPYDFMALVPVVEGAGGVISDWHGQPLGLQSEGHVLAAATTELHERALNVLRL